MILHLPSLLHICPPSECALPRIPQAAYYFPSSHTPSILQQFPGDSLSAVLQNVFAFDSYHSELKALVVKTLHKHGIPVGASPGSVKLADQ